MSEPFSADIPDEIRRRSAAQEMKKVLDSVGVHSPDLVLPHPDVPERLNCSLHFLSPEHVSIPSFATVIGLSLCSECTLRAGSKISQRRMSAAEMIDLALIGHWLNGDEERSEEEGEAA